VKFIKKCTSYKLKPGVEKGREAIGGNQSQRVHLTRKEINFVGKGVNMKVASLKGGDEDRVGKRRKK